MDFNRIIQNFQTTMFSHGITPPENIVADGQLHRFYIKRDKQGSKNGWYILYIDNISCGVFGSWKMGITHKWCAKKQKSMSDLEKKKFQQHMAEAKQQREELRRKEQAEAAKKAEYIYHHCHAPNSNHLYLVKKRIKPFYARQKGDCLVLPIVDFDGNYWSLQFITPRGDKFFLSNGAITGHFIPIQHQPVVGRKILICEGFATSASIALAYPDACVLASCNAGNLKSVAIDIRQHLPKAEITICADIDPVGLTKAKEAAIAAKTLLKKPNFPPSANQKFTDFNDLFCWFASKGCAT